MLHAVLDNCVHLFIAEIRKDPQLVERDGVYIYPLHLGGIYRNPVLYLGIFYRINTENFLQLLLMVKASQTAPVSGYANRKPRPDTSNLRQFCRI